MSEIYGLRHKSALHFWRGNPTNRKLAETIEKKCLPCLPLFAGCTAIQGGCPKRSSAQNSISRLTPTTTSVGSARIGIAKYSRARAFPCFKPAIMNTPIKPYASKKPRVPCVQV